MAWILVTDMREGKTYEEEYIYQAKNGQMLLTDLLTEVCKENRLMAKADLAMEAFMIFKPTTATLIHTREHAKTKEKKLRVCQLRDPATGKMLACSETDPPTIELTITRDTSSQRIKPPSPAKAKRTADEDAGGQKKQKVGTDTQQEDASASMEEDQEGWTKVPGGTPPLLQSQQSEEEAKAMGINTLSPSETLSTGVQKLGVESIFNSTDENKVRK